VFLPQLATRVGRSVGLLRVAIPIGFHKNALHERSHIMISCKKFFRVPMDSYETSAMMDTHRINHVTVFANKASARCPGAMTFQDTPYDEEKQEEHGEGVRCKLAVQEPL